VEAEHPNASTAAKWQLAQAEASQRLRKSRLELGGEKDSGL
jgi:hypothetical protein